MACPHCQGVFIEQVEEFRSPGRGAGAGVGAGVVVHGADAESAEGMGLTDEQRRRLFNAAALLQLLEAHLREEFLALENAVREAEANKAPRHLSGLEKHVFLKTAPVDADSLCSQPACPVCSEDFNVDEEALQIQCSHFFHESCVVPWLELKHNCPICRCEVSDKLPSPEQIQELTATEIRQRIVWHGQRPCPSESKAELASSLHSILVESRDAYDIANPIEMKERSTHAPAAAASTAVAVSGGGGDGDGESGRLRPGFHTYSVSSSAVLTQSSGPPSASLPLSLESAVAAVESGSVQQQAPR
jgi:hypothetical protein